MYVPRDVVPANVLSSGVDLQHFHREAMSLNQVGAPAVKPLLNHRMLLLLPTAMDEVSIMIPGGLRSPRRRELRASEGCTLRIAGSQESPTKPGLRGKLDATANCASVIARCVVRLILRRAFARIAIARAKVATAPAHARMDIQ